MISKEVEMGERFWLIPNSDHRRTQKSLSRKHYISCYR